MYCGATQRLRLFTSVMVVVSGGASCESEFAPHKSPAAPADESVARKRRRFCCVCTVDLLRRRASLHARRQRQSALQLALEFVPGTPIRAIGKDLVGGRLDHAG